MGDKSQPSEGSGDVTESQNPIELLLSGSTHSSKILSNLASPVMKIRSMHFHGAARVPDWRMDRRPVCIPPSSFGL
jgi:hypothetical protein